MKFNWRANWEILLVLVIIVVGIVITTIAAIRNKDKHLLPLAEETDFGQLIGSTGGYSESGAGGGSSSLANGSIAHASSAIDSDEGPGGGGNLAIGPVNGAESSLLSSNSRRSPPAPIAAGGGAQANPKLRSAAANYNQLAAASGAASAHQQQHPYDAGSRGHSKFEEEQQTGAHQQQPLATSSARFVGGLGSAAAASQAGETYEPMNTEPTPNQLLRGSDFAPPNQSQFQSSPHNHHQLNQLAARFQNQFAAASAAAAAAARRNTTRNQQMNDQQQQVEGAASNYNDPMGESVELIDDIHTTRSSLGSNNILTGGVSSSLSLHAPYGASLPSNNPALNHNLLLAHNAQQQNKQQSEVPESVEDLMNLYPYRGGSNITTTNGGDGGSANSTEAQLFRDYNPLNGGAGLNSNLTSQQQQYLNSAMLANLLSGTSMPSNQPLTTNGGGQHDMMNQSAQSQQSLAGTTSHQHRAFSSLLPISVILSDILKLTRLHQLQPNSNTQSSSSSLDQQQQQLSARQHPGILNQSRFPGSLLGLLQSLSAAGSSSQQGAAASSMSGDMALPYDASESSQHYHRISMSPTDVIHSVMARSMSGSGVLPAFPPPKGVTQNWIPPTSGGHSEFNEAMSSNADFVASNAAGFVRAAGESGGQSAAGAAASHNHDVFQTRQSSGPSSSSSPTSSSGSTQTENLPTPPTFYPQQQSTTNPVATNQDNQGQKRQLHQQQQYQQTSSNMNFDHQSGPMQGGGSNQMNDRSSGWPPQMGGMSFVGNAAQRQQVVGSGGNRPAGQQTSFPNNMNNLQQQQQQQQAYMGIAQARTMAQTPSKPSRAPAINPNNNNLPGLLTPAPLTMYNSRVSSSEIQVPLGYNPTTQQQLVAAGGGLVKQPQQQAVPVVYKQQQQTSNNLNQVQQQKTTQQQQLRRRKRSISQAASKTNPSSTEQGFRVDEVMSSRYGSSSTDDDEDDGDARPISVVRPDGRPMPNKGRVRGFTASSSTTTNWLKKRPAASEDVDTSTSDDTITTTDNNNLDRQPAQSQRSANHLDMSRQQYAHHPSSGRNKIRMSSMNGGRKYNHNGHHYKENHPHMMQPNHLMDDAGDNHVNHQKRGSLGAGAGGSSSRRRQQQQHKNNLETASSGLMSKLLSTASTNDELEEELDDDDADGVNEKRKEEIEDAEFGLNDDARQVNPPQPRPLLEVTNNAVGNDEQQQNNHSPHMHDSQLTGSDHGHGNVHKLQSESGGGHSSSDSGAGSNGGGGDSTSSAVAQAGLSSDSTDNESYARRNQQRSDIEFYGHPGEETRQLKYGILGSGNYEVVNGGIYPEADESTAAVNSVANYVRKPGGGATAGLLSSLPKLLAGAEPASVRLHQGSSAAYMPGGRVLGGGGGGHTLPFMRGASSANAEDLANLLVNPNPALTDKENSMAAGPLLELIDATSGGQLFDPSNILAQLGSSGSQTRTTHTSQEGQDEREASGDGLDEASGIDGARRKRKKEGEESRTKKRKPESNGRRKSNRHPSSSLDDQVDQNDTESSSNEDQGREKSINSSSSSDNDTSSQLNSNQLQRQQSSISGFRSGSKHGMNQFNSYQISPSKKVTIFSDQDLDSAPSTSTQQRRISLINNNSNNGGDVSNPVQIE